MLSPTEVRGMNRRFRRRTPQQEIRDALFPAALTFAGILMMMLTAQG